MLSLLLWKEEVIVDVMIGSVDKEATSDLRLGPFPMFLVLFVSWCAILRLYLELG